jgi:hypothetical protein
MFFLVSCVLQRKYGRLNKHVNLLGQFNPLTPVYGSQQCDVPFLIFHIPRLRRQLKLKVTGLDKPPMGHGPRVAVVPSANGTSVWVFSGRYQDFMDSFCVFSLIVVSILETRALHLVVCSTTPPV